MENYTIIRTEMRPDRGDTRRCRWVLFRCFCGNEKWIRGWKLHDPKKVSCGCVREVRPVKHGMSKSPEYRTWNKMKDRCTNPLAKKFRIYGARGIKVCERWMEFKNFYEDMGPKPKGLSIERIDNNGNYEPGNCKWAGYEEQNNNRRCTRFINIGGKKMRLTQWAKENGVPYGVAAYRFGFTDRLPKKRTLMHLLDNFP